MTSHLSPPSTFIIMTNEEENEQKALDTTLLPVIFLLQLLCYLVFYSFMLKLLNCVIFSGFPTYQTYIISFVINLCNLIGDVSDYVLVITLI